METNERLIYKLTRLGLNIKKEFNLKLEEHNLTFGQWQVLKAINLEKKDTLSSITKEVNSDRATTNQILNKLLIKKMIVKEKKEGYVNRNTYHIAPETKEKCELYLQLEINIQNKYFMKMTSEEIIFLEKIITKLEEN